MLRQPLRNPRAFLNGKAPFCMILGIQFDEQGEAASCFGLDPVQNAEEEAGSILQSSSPPVRSSVGPAGKKLIDQVSMSGHDLNPIEPCLARTSDLTA